MIAIRVLHESRVVREAVFAELPVTIGRGPGCELLLADPGVSRAHARVECGEDGRARVVDLGSRNGLHVDGRAVARADLNGPLSVRLGQTELEIALVSDCPTLEIPAAALRAAARPRGLAAHFGYVALGVAAVISASVVETPFWNPWNHTRWVSLVGEAIGAAIGLPVLAGLLFLVLKVIGRRVRMADTLRVVSLLAWLIPATDVAHTIAYYPLSPSQFALFKLALGAVTAAIAVAAIASVRREPRSLGFTLGWAGTALAVVAGFSALSAATSRQNGQPNVDLSLQPPVAGYAGRVESFEDYLGSVRQAARESTAAAAPRTAGSEEPNVPVESVAPVQSGRDPR